MITVDRNDQYIRKVTEEFAKFQATMEELRLLRSVADDLRSFRRMMKLKRYD